jgi:hypothetical protein
MAFTWTNTAATTAAVTNRFVTSVNMANGAYTLANTTPVWSGACIVTATITAVTGNDTAGTLTVVGVDLSGQTRTEVITLAAGSGGTGVVPFRTITSITQAGWVINVGNDTIVIGCAAGNIAAGTGGVLQGVLVNNTVATAFTVADATRTILTVPVSQAAGTYYSFGAGVDFGGLLKVLTTSTNDVTVFHSGTLPSTAAL